MTNCKYYPGKKVGFNPCKTQVKNLNVLKPNEQKNMGFMGLKANYNPIAGLWKELRNFTLLIWNSGFKTQWKPQIWVMEIRKKSWVINLKFKVWIWFKNPNKPNEQKPGF